MKPNKHNYEIDLALQAARACVYCNNKQRKNRKT